MKNKSLFSGLLILVSVIAAAGFSANAGQASSLLSAAKATGTEAMAIVATATRKAAATKTPAADEYEKVDLMNLLAEKATTEHSDRPEDFEEPESLEDIVEPDEDSWRPLLPGRDTDFETYDGVRLSKNGQALLDLGDLIKLILKRETVTQFVPETLAQEELDRIEVDFDDTPLLQRIVLTLHLSRGGFLGKKSVDSGPIALTTPNAIVIVSGTEFFLVYDPETEATWVGNFGGTIKVADVDGEEGDDLDDDKLVVITPDSEPVSWPIHKQMTFDEFDQLIDQLESPVAAADMISGPYLVGQFRPRLNVRRGPGTNYATVGILAEGEYARIKGKWGGWWRIACPKSTYAKGVQCWVAGAATYTRAYNEDDVDFVSPPATPTPIATPTPVPVTPRASTGGENAGELPTPDIGIDVTNCSYIGGGRFRFDTAFEKGVEGIWRSGCPSDPKIDVRACSISWEAGSNNVRSASISYDIKGITLSEEEPYSKSGQFNATLPEGSVSISLPYQFEGEVIADFKAVLDNGVQDTKKASRYFSSECYSEGQVFEFPLK